MSDVDFQRGVETGKQLGRQLERDECHRAIMACVREGELQGNGCDELAWRNGLIMAANAIMVRKP